jgi:hypothetical protein
MGHHNPGINGGASEPTMEEIASFLRSHPDFFSRCPELLRHLMPPARYSGDTVIDLQQYMVGMLRDELAGLRDCAHTVIETSRLNLATQMRTHAAVLAMIGAESLAQMVRIVTGDLPIFLDVDAAALALEGTADLTAAAPELRLFEWGTVDRLLGLDQDVALFQQFSDDGELFGTNAGRIKSAAFARLQPGAPSAEGVLILGAFQEDTFDPRQGTDLLRFLAQVCEVCLKRLLPQAV